MRWTHLAAVLAVCSATTCLAETPEWSGSRPQAMQLFQGRLFSGQGWWSRYGEPVNSQALAQAEALPPAADKTAPIVPVSDYGDGYVYGQGACDCPPPCISHLWNGYFQNPKRCRPHAMQHFAGGNGFGNGGNGGCNSGCNTCGDGCNSCGGCAPFRTMAAKLFGHGCCDSCNNDSCSCTSSVSCTTAAPDCGCKPVCGKCRPCHLANAWHCFAAHWHCNSCCDSCSSSVGCGCTTATPSVEVPSEKQASQRPPVPLPEEALLHPLPRLN
jgi:hypothetical protein